MKTHLALGVMAGLFFLPDVTHKWVFIPVLLIASLLPDIDIGSSYMGKKWYFRPLQWFVKHRGIIHSLTLCIVLSFAFAYFIPIIALPFFLGYSLHLIGDSLTSEGIRPFWPLKKEARGIVRVGGKVEESIFVVFLILDVILIIGLFL